MKKIVYLFGAGASCQALPLITQIPNRLKNFIKVLKSDELLLSDNEAFEFTNHLSKRYFQQVVIEDTEWLLDKSSNHASVDTFAKKLFITGNEPDLLRLQLALSVFFTYEQLVNKPDSRYDSFFAALLSYNAIDLPKQVRLISWNYDYQFELAFAEFSETNRLLNNFTQLNVSFKNSSRKHLPGKFGIFKLNGSAGVHQFNHHIPAFVTDFRAIVNKPLLEQMVRLYGIAVTQPQNAYSDLSFAWIPDHSGNDIVERTIKETSDAAILVVIGYSFPFFNREVDRKIIGSMVGLEKVYFQDPNANDIAERFEAINDKSASIKQVLKHDVGQFFLPNEL